MPDLELPPLLLTPLPDRAHEDLRLAMVAAFGSLLEQIERINDAFLLLSVTADFSQATLATAQAGRKSIAHAEATGGGLAQQLAALTARVAALETPSTTGS